VDVKQGELLPYVVQYVDGAVIVLVLGFGGGELLAGAGYQARSRGTVFTLRPGCGSSGEIPSGLHFRYIIPLPPPKKMSGGHNSLQITHRLGLSPRKGECHLYLIPAGSSVTETMGGRGLIPHLVTVMLQGKPTAADCGHTDELPSLSTAST